MLDPMLRVTVGDRHTVIPLSAGLTATLAEEAERLGHAWIKSLRSVVVDGRTFRDCFTYRGDSLWWFAELYLHKQRTSVQIASTILSLETLLSRERVTHVALVSGGFIARVIAPQVAARFGVAYRDETRGRWRDRAGALATRAVAHLYAASPRFKRWRGGRSRSLPPPGLPAAFVHTAFWRGDDVYVGPVLSGLASHLGGRLTLVGVGAPTTFGARTWPARLSRVRRKTTESVPLPVEQFAKGAIGAAGGVWRDRHVNLRSLEQSEGLRAAAIVRGCDVWPIVREDLRGIALLQFPWSARVMDEAGAALDALRPPVVVTYAEAGGWGRALVLEARRRHIPVVAIQHGFISRHWLNYLHEPDELAPSPENPQDAGCPVADLTLLYDRFVRRHLIEAGRYPPDRLEVVGNPRLDVLVRQARSLFASDLERIRRESGAREGQHLVVIAAKRIPEFDESIGALMRAARDMPDVHVVVKPHPAETTEPYERLAAGAANVRVLPPSADLVGLVAAARLVATINSTVAVEAMALDVPALAMRLPNYLSPFVEAGAMAGTAAASEIGPALVRLVRDEGARAELAARRRSFVEEHGFAATGDAVERAVAAILRHGTTPQESRKS